LENLELEKMYFLLTESFRKQT